ncbi:MAG: hypothetical protein JO143_08965 [Acetobacteraceae bacterium]|nr:hypothetical protein [Acetobacteraceae bacterium]
MVKIAAAPTLAGLVLGGALCAAALGLPQHRVCGVGYYEELASGLDHPHSPQPASSHSAPLG